MPLPLLVPVLRALACPKHHHQPHIIYRTSLARPTARYDGPRGSWKAFKWIYIFHVQSASQPASLPLRMYTGAAIHNRNQPQNSGQKFYLFFCRALFHPPLPSIQPSLRSTTAAVKLLFSDCAEPPGEGIEEERRNEPCSGIVKEKDSVAKGERAEEAGKAFIHLIGFRP